MVGVFLCSSDIPSNQILPIKIKTGVQEVKLNAEIIGKLKSDTLPVFNEISSKLQYVLLARFNTDNTFENPSNNKENPTTAKDLYHIICQGTKGDPFVIYTEEISPIGFEAYSSQQLAEQDPFQLLFLLNPIMPYVEAIGKQLNNIQLTNTVILDNNQEPCKYKSTVTFLRIPHDHLERLVLHSVQTGKIKIPSLSEIALLTVELSNLNETLERLRYVEHTTRDDAQKRQYMRAPIKLKMFYKDQDNRLRNGMTIDISAGGIGFISETDLPIGAEISITIVMPDGLPTISCN